MFIFTNPNTVVAGVAVKFYAVVYIMTIVAVDRWYAYYLVQMLLPNLE